MKTQIEAAAWARKLADSKKRQWTQVDVFYEDLVPLIEALQAVQFEMPDLGPLQEVIDPLRELAGLGLVLTEEQATALSETVTALEDLLLDIEIDPIDQALQAHSDLGEALEMRASAEMDSGVDRADGLAAAWDEVVANLSLLADALETLEPSTPVVPVTPDE